MWGQTTRPILSLSPLCAFKPSRVWDLLEIPCWHWWTPWANYNIRPTHCVHIDAAVKIISKSLQYRNSGKQSENNCWTHIYSVLEKSLHIIHIYVPNYDFDSSPVYLCRALKAARLHTLLHKCFGFQIKEMLRATQPWKPQTVFCYIKRFWTID